MAAGLRLFGAALCFAYLAAPLPSQEAAGGDWERWAAELKNPEVKARREAAYQLQRMGAQAAPAVPALTEALRDDDVQVWSQAVTALAEIGPEAREAAPVLLEALRQEGQRGSREQVWYRSAYALGRIGPSILPELTEALRDESAGARSGAAKALGWQGPVAAEAVPDLIGLLADGDETVREETVAALAEIGAASVTPLTAALSELDLNVKRGAADGLGRIGEAAAPSRDALLREWGEQPDPGLRSVLLTALRRTGLEPEQLLPLLSESLSSDHEVLRQAAVDNLVAHRAVAGQVVPEMRRLLREGAPLQGELAALVLGRLGAPASEAVPDLLQGLGGENEAAYVRALQEMGSVVWPAVFQEASAVPVAELGDDHWAVRLIRSMALGSVSQLAEGLGSENPSVRFLSLRGMREVGRLAKGELDAVTPLVEDADERVRGEALRAVAVMGLDDRKLHALVSGALEDESPAVRAAAVAAVGSLEGQASLVMPVALDGLQDPAPEVQAEALRALTDLGPEGQEAVPLLRERLESASPAGQVAILEALAAVAPGSAETAAAAARSLEGASDPALKAAALAGLRASGSAAAEFRPLVRQALGDPEETVRAEAVAAFAAVESDPEQVMPVLKKALGDGSGSVRRPAIQAASRLGEQAQPLAPEMFALLGSEEDRQQVVEALREIRPRNVELWVEALKNPEARVRVFACVALGRMGKEAEPALPELRKMLRDEYDFVRERAREALRSIESS